MNTRSFYDRISGAYDLLADSSEGACRNRGLTMLDIRPGERVLEIGVGTGHALVALASSAGRVAGIDISPGMLAVTRRTLLDAGRPGVACLLNDARTLSFRDDVFDAVFMSFTLELFESTDINRVLTEIRRVLRPLGRLAVVGMDETGVTNRAVGLYKWLHRHFPYFVDCRPIDVGWRLATAGFHVTSTEPMTIWGLPVLCAVGINRARGNTR